jgi:RND family efflux transporter MFP subunit
VSSQTTLFEIAQLNPLKVTVNISDQLIASISNGTAANISVPELGTSVFQGNVDKISPVLDSVSHAYPVEITISNPQNTLLPGMTASVQFLSLKTMPGIIIPAEAVVETAQGSEVFTVDQNVAHMHLVQLGAVSNDKILVSTGLQAGDEVIIKGQTLIADNTPVKIVDDSDQAGVQGMVNQVKQGAKQ